MAGYNANKMTDETFTGRQKNIGETLQEKYGLTQAQVDGLISGELTEEDFTGKQYNLKGTNKQTNLITNLINIEKARKNFGNATGTTDQIIDIKTDTKTNNQNDGSSAFDPSGPTQTSIRSEREDKSGRGQSGGFTNPGKGSYGPHMADGGRAGYFYGGRVNFKNGGLASIL